MKNRFLHTGTKYYLQGHGTENLAIFEKFDDGIFLVSAALGISTMRYNDEMTCEQARAYWQELIAQGWTKTTSNKTHSDIWNLYA